MPLSQTLRDAISTNNLAEFTPWSWFWLSEHDKIDVFLFAAIKGNRNALNHFATLTTDTGKLNNMIGRAFVWALRNGNRNIINDTFALVLPTEREYVFYWMFEKIIREQAGLPTLNQFINLINNETFITQFIHTKNHKIFSLAASYGDLEVVNRLIEITQNRSGLQHDMIHANHNRPFYWAALNGHVNIMNRLVEITRDLTRQNAQQNGTAPQLIDALVENAVQAMIHDDGEKAFNSAASNGHIDAINFLVELVKSNEARQLAMESAALAETPAEEIDTAVQNVIQTQIERMACTDNHRPFWSAALCGHINSMNRIIELVTSKEAQRLARENARRNGIGEHLIDDAVKNAIQTRLYAMIAEPDDLSGEKKITWEFIDIISPLPEPETFRPKNTKPDKTKKLRQLRGDLIVKFGEDSPVPNRVIVAIMSTYNALKSFSDTALNTRILADSDLILHKELIQQIAKVLTPVDFTKFGLDEAQSHQALEVVRGFFEKSVMLPASVVERIEARRKIAASSEAVDASEYDERVPLITSPVVKAISKLSSALEGGSASTAPVDADAATPPPSDASNSPNPDRTPTEKTRSSGDAAPLAQQDKLLNTPTL
jgi:Ankyrin repeats (3 copies)